jgi:hypothetical protein
MVLTYGIGDMQSTVRPLLDLTQVLYETGDVIEEPRTLTIDVKPGMPTGTRFVFEG